MSAANPFVVRKVLGTGSRDHYDTELIWGALDEFRGTDDEILVNRPGFCRGSVG